MCRARNCWSFAWPRFEEHGGWLLVRHTRRSTARPALRSLGWIMVAVGLWLINWGARMRTGKWLHVYHAQSVNGPYTSYEPSNGGDRKSVV